MNKPERRLILGVDPGTTKTAYTVYDSETKRLQEFGHVPNNEFLEKILYARLTVPSPTHMAIEMMASMGMPVGQTTFETAAWIGRFIQAWLDEPGHTYEFIYRVDEKLHLCGDARAKDPNIRQAIMDRYGSTRELAIGNKKNPGPLYEVTNDVWSSIAIAITAAELDPTARRGHGAVTL